MKALSVVLLALSYLKILCQKKSEPNIPIGTFEKDMLLACAEIQAYEDIMDAYGDQRDRVGSKISAEMFSECMNRIDEPTTKSIIENLVFHDFSWRDDYDKLVEIDYMKYRLNTTDIELPLVHKIMLYKLEKTRAEYRNKTKPKQDEDGDTIKIQLDLNNQVSPFRMDWKYFFIGVIAVVSGMMIMGLIYFLCKVRKKKEPSKKKKEE